MKTPKDIHGVIAPPFTVFHEDGTIDYEATMAHADFVMDKGVDALLLMGSTQECKSMSEEEYKELIAAYVNHVNGRLPILAGIVESDTDKAVRLAEYLCSLGVDAVFSGQPYPNMAKEDLLARHEAISAAAAKAGIPYLLYNNPEEGDGLSVWEIAELTHRETVRLIKDTTADPVRMLHLKMYCAKGTKVFYGEDYGSYQALTVDIDGWTPGLSNLIPEETVRLWKLMREKKYEEGLALWKKMQPLADMITLGRPSYGLSGEECYWLPLYKEGARYRNGTPAYVRPPEKELPAEDREVLIQRMKALGY